MGAKSVIQTFIDELNSNIKSEEFARYSTARVLMNSDELLFNYKLRHLLIKIYSSDDIIFSVEHELDCCWDIINYQLDVKQEISNSELLYYFRVFQKLKILMPEFKPTNQPTSKGETL